MHDPRLRRRRLARALTAAVVAGAAALAGAARAGAHSYGAPSTIFRELRQPGCNGCHAGGATPVVTVTASARELVPGGAPLLLTVTVTTPNGDPGAAGFDLSASRAGQFARGGPASEATMIVRGLDGRSEATHQRPKPGEPAVFSALWTPAAGVTGPVTFTAWGAAVDGDAYRDGPRGDRASRATVDVIVSARVTRAGRWRGRARRGHFSPLLPAPKAE
jgi:hypothetical protein